MKKVNLLALLTFTLLITRSFAQECNCVESLTDLTITSGQTAVVNVYHAGASDALTGSTSISIGAKRTIPGAFTDLGGTISAGDLLMIIQMQGAEINPTISDITVTFEPGADDYTTSDYGDGPGGLDHEGFLNNGNYIAGQYEFVVATNSVGGTGGTLTIKEGLMNSYIANSTPTATIGKRTFQVIKVGNYRHLTVDAGGEITTVPWNGSTGGVITLDVLGRFNLNGRVDADFAGFRGGHLNLSGGDNNDPDNGVRGEGIAGTPQQVFGFNDDFTSISGSVGLTQGYPGGTQAIDCDIDFNGILANNRNIVWTADRGQGAPGNAGGGGLLNNGGGGGSNGSRGGNGANEGTISSGGGASIDIDNGSRFVLGGGGGSGGQSDAENDGFPEDVNSGRPGGGAILIRADTLESTGSTGVITTNGSSGNTFAATNTTDQDQDGSAGGGGAGGTVILLTSSENISGATVSATGGDGSGLTGVQVFNSPDGGGGGGSGGNVMLVRRGAAFSALPTIDVSGGASGATQGTPDDGSTGGNGAVSLLTTPPASNLDCPLITLPAPAPGGVTSSILWLEPRTDVTYNGTQQVSAWNDLSASNFDLTNTGVTGLTGTTPDYIPGSFTGIESSSNPGFNFNPSISFNEGADTDDYLAFENFTNININEFTIYAVVNFPSASPNDQTVFSYLPNDSQTDELDLGISNDSGSDGIQQSILDNPVNRSGDIRDEVTRIIATDHDNTDVNIYTNNGTASNTALSAGTFDASGTFVVGQDLDAFTTPSFDGNRELQGQIGDVIYFSRVLSANEHQRVSSYLSIKYGITMDQNTNQDYLNSIGEAVYPVASDAANYATYDHDIAGIGRDDGTQLQQLRSKSINADAIMTGSLAAGFSTDRQYVVWGNNDGGTIFNTTEISAGILNRIQREWRIAVANSPDPIDLVFDLSGTTNTPTTTDNLTLVIDDDGDFSNGFLRTMAASSWDGATATFQSVSLNDDEVLTIASVPDSPGGVVGNILWLKANAGISSTGGFVIDWADQSSSGLNAVSSGVNRPVLQNDDVNFNPSLAFDGGDFMNAGNNLNLDPGVDEWTFMSTFNVDVGDFGTILSRASGGTGARQYQYFVNGGVFGQIIGGNLNDDGTAPATGNWTLGSATLSTSALNSYVGSALDDPGTPGTAANENTDLLVGARTNGTGFILTGEIGEIVMFNSSLSDFDRNRAESYLAIKYGLTLDGTEADYLASDGDFIYETVVVPNDYNNDIAGIGRDDISDLDQRSSQSVNTDAVVTMALTDNGGTFASPNAFTANLSFMAWGNDNDDNGTIEDVNTDIPSNVLLRLDREWRVQEKGTVGNVTLTIDISGVDPDGAEADFTGRTAAGFMLLIDDGGDFSNGITRSFSPVSYDAASEVVTFEVDFEDGDIFTLATSLSPSGPGGVTSGIQLWLRGDEGVVDVAGNITWDDQSGNGNHAIQSGGNTTTGVSTVNGRNVIDADNLNRTFTTGSITGQTIIYAGHASATGNGSFSGYLGFDGDQGIRQDLNGVAEFRNPGNTDDWSNAGNFYYNGVSNTTTNITDVGTFHVGVVERGSAVTGDFYLGGYFNNRFYTGNTQYGDVIVYNDILTADELVRVESYLASSYGITMNGGDFDYTSSAGSVYYPGNTDTEFNGFRNDVATIGRDDNSGFNQLTSSSVNGTSVLTISKNANFNSDNQFFTWGHSGDAISSSSATDFPSGIESRLDREWKVKTVNNPSGGADFTFDLSTLTISEASDLRILVDSDGDFSNATVLNPTVLQVGDNYTFSGVDLSSFPDGSFFTVASIDDTDSPLPLDFLSFAGREESGLVQLNWKTTNEIGVSHFEIERSQNGIDFQSIGQLEARNVSDAINSYDYLDGNPFTKVNYYRIKQVDFDGAFEYTDIVFVIVEGETLQITVHPNPTTERLNITSNLPSSGRLRVIDLYGNTVLD
ncbi:MAG: hypothetical protein AAGA66_15285, partial [Bacteroidota bacterium]